MRETIAANLEESWQPIVTSNVAKNTKRNRQRSDKRPKECTAPSSYPSKKPLFEVVDGVRTPDYTDSKLADECNRENPNDSKVTNTATVVCFSEEGTRLSESIPSSPVTNQNPTIDALSHFQTPPDCTAANLSDSQPQIFQFHEGPKLFVSEMFINQRELYQEFELRISADPTESAPKFQICETSLELPDIAFSATSCALVFNRSDFWINIQVIIQILFFDIVQVKTLFQKFPVDFPDTMQEILWLLNQAGFKRCMLLLYAQVMNESEGKIV